MNKNTPKKHDEILNRLKESGVRFSREKAPFGKIKNVSFMIGDNRPIVIADKKSSWRKFYLSIKNVFWK